MFKNILIPIAFDQEHEPEQALATAKLLAGTGATVTVMHVLADVPGYAISYMPEGYKEELNITIQDALDKYAQQFENGRTALRSGNAPDQILAQADETGVDCIIIDSHRPGFSDYLIGSTAARVVRHGKCPVMVLR